MQSNTFTPPAVKLSETWGIIDWLSDYATLHQNPKYPENSPYPDYEAEISAAAAPDYIAHFPRTDYTIVLFLVDADNPEKFATATSADSALFDYLCAPGYAGRPNTTEDTEPDAAALVTQYSQFGHLCESTTKATAEHIESEPPAFNDRQTAVVCSQLTNHLSYKHHQQQNLHGDIEETQHSINVDYGVLLGDPITLGQPKPPKFLKTPSSTGVEYTSKPLTTQ